MPESMPVQRAEILVLGDRNYPLHPTIKIPTLLTTPLAGLLKTAQSRVPDITYDDLVKAIWSLGVNRLTAALDAGLVVERGGVVKEPALSSKPAAGKPAEGPKRGAAAAVLPTLRAKTEIVGDANALVGDPDGSVS
jgi:hypothetical protein